MFCSACAVTGGGRSDVDTGEHRRKAAGQTNSDPPSWGAGLNDIRRYAQAILSTDECMSAGPSMAEGEPKQRDLTAGIAEDWPQPDSKMSTKSDEAASAW